MAIQGASVPTLVDIANRLDPNGKLADIAEMLNQSNELLDDMSWREGNLPTGERTTVRTGLPSVGFRRLNEGLPISKSTTSQVEEGAAMLEAFSQVDRKVAILSGNVARFRLDESKAFLESMNQRMALTTFYGNAGASPNEFTGLAPRYNSKTGVTGQNIVEGGGSGTRLRSVWLVGWGENTITGIYPKGTKAGLFHDDVTANRNAAGDGYPIGDSLFDGNGNRYLGYVDHYEWNCGLSVKDWRFAVRIANIDLDALTKNNATGADLMDLLIQATELIQSTTGVRAAFYAPRTISSWFRRQAVNRANAILTLEDIQGGGRKMLSFDGIPIKRTDALNVDEQRVT